MFSTLSALALAQGINPNTAPAYSGFLEQVDALDLTAVEADLKKDGLTEEEVAQAIQEYKRFLAIVPLSEAGLVPSPVADKAWHAHIVRTIAYADAMNDLFGTFIHHQPGTPEGAAVALTTDLAERVFGAAWTPGCDCCKGRCKNAAAQIERMDLMRAELGLIG